MRVARTRSIQFTKAAMLLIAISLSSVTAISVGITMFSMIDSFAMSIMFATAAIVLDLYKYLAWPLAIGMWAQNKKFCALLMIMSAISLGVVSAWATYDRLYTSISASQIRFESSQMRISDLVGMRAVELGRLDLVDANARSISEQAKQLRDRGMVTKAQDLDSLAVSAADTQRQRILARVAGLESEIAALQTTSVPSASLPALIVAFVCAGFALALETVPALLGVALRTADSGLRPSERSSTYAESSDLVTESALTTATSVADEAATSKTRATLPVARTTGQQQDLFGPDDTRLMQTLISITESSSPGTPIKVRDFTAAAKVGNRRTIKLFHAAMEVGLLKRTSVGYVAA